MLRLLIEITGACYCGVSWIGWCLLSPWSVPSDLPHVLFRWRSLLCCT